MKTKNFISIAGTMICLIMKDYQKKSFFSLLAGLFLFVASPSLFVHAQESQDIKRREIVVILDVSESMKSQNKFPHVQYYLENEVVGKFLRNGDDFSLVTFSERVTERFTRTINSDADKKALKADLRRLQANGNFTDIGVVIEKLAEIIERPERDDTRRIILFITDGLNNPPLHSNYFGVDISLDARLRNFGERIACGAWFFYLIGIGRETAAQDIANLVPGSELLTTSPGMNGVDFTSRVVQQEEKEQDMAEVENIPKVPEFPLEFRGTWRREGPSVYTGTITITANTYRISTQYTHWILIGVSGNGYTIAQSDYHYNTGVETIRFVSGNLVITGCTGTGENNCNGIWIRE